MLDQITDWCWVTALRQVILVEEEACLYTLTEQVIVRETLGALEFLVHDGLWVPARVASLQRRVILAFPDLIWISEEWERRVPIENAGCGAKHPRVSVRVMRLLME